MEGGPRGKEEEQEASAPSLLLSSRRPRPARAPTPEPLPPLPTKLRILRGARGVNKTYWSVPEKRDGQGKEGGGGGAESAETKGGVLPPLLPPPPQLALFFGGDEVAAADSHPDVVRLQTPAAQAAACSRRYSSDDDGDFFPPPQVVVVVPSRHEAGWACFDHFFSFPSAAHGGGLTRSGEPAPPGYSAAGLPALAQATSLLRDGGWPLAAAACGGGGVGGDGSTLDVEELKRMRAGVGGGGGGSGGEASSSSCSSSSSSPPWPATKVVAFSKGGVVANQMLFELSTLGHAGFRRRQWRRRRRGGGGGESGGGGGGGEAKNVAAVEKLLLLPGPGGGSNGSSSPAALLPPPPHARNLNPLPYQQSRPELLARSLAPAVAALAAAVDGVVFLDAGLNCRGAYGVTDPEVARGLALLDSLGEEEEEETGGGESEGGAAAELPAPPAPPPPPPLRVELVGTPRQWGDRSRAWLLEEKERMLRCLERAGVAVSSELVLEGRRPDLRTHFLGIEAFGRGGGGGGRE